jgi:hypothetical protein
VKIITNANDAAKTLAALQRDFPREFKSGMKAGGGAVKKQVSKALGRNTVGLPPLSSLTRKINKAKSRKNRLGGILSKSVKSLWTGTKIFVGWPEGLRKYGEKFQSGERRERTPQEMSYLYAKGIATKKNAETFARYVRPKRPFWKLVSKDKSLILTFAAAVQKAIAAMIARKTAKK